MKFTYYSDIFKSGNYIFIVELYKDLEEKHFMKITKILENTPSDNNQMLYLSEEKKSYNSDFYLVLINQKNKKKYTHVLKKELTINLQKLKKNQYIVAIKNKITNKKILKLRLF